MSTLKSSDDLIAELDAELEDSTQAELAKRLRVSETYLSDVLNERRRISDQFALKLGYERVVRWRKVRN